MPTKVLVFESDSGFAHELQSGLAAYGCEVTVVDDATLGLQAAASNKPDLVLLAIELPKMNGFSVCNKLKRDAALKSVPLIIMSSDSTEETFEQHRRLRTRAEDYLHKPIGVTELVEKIRPFVPLAGPEAAPEAAPGLSKAEEVLLDEDPLVEEAPALEVSESELDAALDAELLDEELVEIEVGPNSEEPGFEAEERPSIVDADVEDFADNAFDAILETPAEAAQHLEPPQAVTSSLELESTPDLEMSADLRTTSSQTLHSQVSYDEALAHQAAEELELGSALPEPVSPEATDAEAPGAPLEAEAAPAEAEMEVLDAEEAFEDMAPDGEFDPAVDSLPPPSRVPDIPTANPSTRPITSSPPRGSSFPPRPNTSIPITFDQERSRLESRIAELEGELGKARARAQQLDDTLQRGLAKDGEVQKLRRELDDAKAKLSSGTGAGSAREFLDLREQLNRKDKEILEVRDELSHKEKELLGLRDNLLSLEREKADSADRATELERRATELERAAEAFKNDKDQANKRADDFKRKAEKLRTEFDAKASEFAELRNSLDAELRKKDEEHALSLEQLDAQYSAQLAELGERRQAAVAEAQQAFDANLSEALEKAKLAAEAELAATSQLLKKQAADELALREADLKAQSEAALSQQKIEHERTIAELQAAHDQALAELQAKHEQALAAQLGAHNEALAERERSQAEAASAAEAEHARTLAATVDEYQTQLRQAQAQAEATLSQQKAEWDAALATHLAALNDENAQALLALEQAVGTAEASLDAEKHAHAQTRSEREREQAAASERISQLTQKITELEAAYAQERADSEALRTELTSVQELLHDTSIRLARDADSARTQAALEIEQAQRKAKEDTERLQAELGAELAAAQSRAAELSHERDQLRTELAATRESLGTELGETRSALKDEQERNRNAVSKWEQDRGSLERAKDALAAALAQIEETEGRPLS